MPNHLHRTFFQIAILSTLISLVGCDKSNSDQQPSADALALSDLVPAHAKFSEINAAELSEHLNQLSILKKFDVSSFIFPQPPISNIARNASGIEACITKKINSLPISVTSDTARVDYNLDLTSLCDEAPKDIETVPEVSNTAHGTIQVTCAGANFGELDEKQLGQMSRQICNHSGLTFYSFDQSYAARKVILSNENSTEKRIIQKMVGNFNLSQADGNPCFIKVVEDDYEFSPCRVVHESKSFNGDESNEQLSANDPKGESVFISYLDFGAMHFETGATYFNNSAVQFWVNGWRGTVHYTNGWAPPRWEATKDEETVSGILGVNTSHTADF